MALYVRLIFANSKIADKNVIELTFKVVERVNKHFNAVRRATANKPLAYINS
jgi:hypothetical protein